MASQQFNTSYQPVKLEGNGRDVAPNDLSTPAGTKTDLNPTDPAQSQTHVRGYQACVPCRERKVKCDLGPVDNPFQPPCARCKREHKHCHFTPSRRKRHRDGDHDETDTLSAASATSSSPTPQGQFTSCSGQRAPVFPELQNSQILRSDPVEAVEPSHNSDDITAIFQQSRSSGPDSALTTLAELAVRRRHLGVNDPIAQELLDIWSRFRFVKEGWLEATEALNYIAYFYKWLAPMSPLTFDNMQDPETLKRMLKNEALLVMAVFTVVSRYMALTGDGAFSRGQALHARFWHEIEDTLRPLLITPSYKSPKSIIHPAHKSLTGLHGLSTVEALLLLVEWHPRAIHFPSDHQPCPLLYDAEDDSESDAGKEDLSAEAEAPWLRILHGTDHKSWTFSQLALAIATENSLYKWLEADMSAHLDHPSTSHSSDFRRAQDIRRLLYVHVSFITARVNQDPLTVDNWDKHLFSDQFVTKAYSSFGAEAHDAAPDPAVDAEFRRDLTLWFWCRLADITNRARTALYLTCDYTERLIKTDGHRQTMQHFEPELSTWSNDLAKCTLITTQMRAMLDIEFGNLRVYINQTALSAVVERCITHVITPVKQVIPTDVLESQIGDYRRFIEDIVDAAQKMLSTVEDLCPTHVRPSEGLIRFAPARIFLRIFNVSTILLKTFTCGATEASMKASFILFDSVARALQIHTVDDLHIASPAIHSLLGLYRTVGAKAIRIHAMARHDRTADQPDRRFPSHGSKSGRIRKPRKPRGKSFLSTVMNPPPRAIVPQSLYPQSEPVNDFAPAQYPIEDFTATSYPTSSSNLSGEYEPILPHMSNTPPANMNPAFPNFNLEDVTMVEAGESGAQIEMDNRHFEEAFGDGLDSDTWAVLPLDDVFQGLQHAPGASVSQEGYGPLVGGRDLLDFF